MFSWNICQKVANYSAKSRIKFSNTLRPRKIEANDTIINNFYKNLLAKWTKNGAKIQKNWTKQRKFGQMLTKVIEKKNEIRTGFLMIPLTILYYDSSRHPKLTERMKPVEHVVPPPLSLVRTMNQKLVEYIWTKICFFTKSSLFE